MSLLWQDLGRPGPRTCPHGPAAGVCPARHHKLPGGFGSGDRSGGLACGRRRGVVGFWSVTVDPPGGTDGVPGRPDHHRIGVPSGR